MAKPPEGVFKLGLGSHVVRACDSHQRAQPRSLPIGVALRVVAGVLGLAASGPSSAVAQPAGPAQPQAASPNAGAEPDWNALLAGQRDALGRSCELNAVAASGALRYLACGEAGVWVVHAEPGSAPAVVERYELDGAVTGFFVRDGHLWAQIATVHARQLAPVDATATTSGAPPPPFSPAPYAQAPRSPAAPQLPVPVAPPPQPAPSAPVSARFGDGRVVEHGPGYVVVNLGVDDGAREGTRIAFFELTQVSVGDGQSMTRRTQVAVGKVESATPERARVVLGLNERIPAGASARITDDPLTAASIAPPRVSNTWEVAFLARPFLVLENLGAGVFGDLRGGYRDGKAGHYEVMLQPIGIATAEQGATTPFAAVVSASYDSRLFEVGLGFGGQTVNDAAFDLDPGTGLTLLQRVRLGARDGLNLEALSYVALFHSEFEFSSVRVTGQIPLSRGSWLLAGGGGGSLGLGYGEIGLRMLLSGNGDRPSFFLTTTVGGVHVFESAACFNDFGPFAGNEVCEPIDYAGPMVGAGGEWRF